MNVCAYVCMLVLGWFVWLVGWFCVDRVQGTAGQMGVGRVVGSAAQQRLRRREFVRPLKVRDDGGNWSTMFA